MRRLTDEQAKEIADKLSPDATAAIQALRDLSCESGKEKATTDALVGRLDWAPKRVVAAMLELKGHGLVQG